MTGVGRNNALEKGTLVMSQLKKSDDNNNQCNTKTDSKKKNANKKIAKINLIWVGKPKEGTGCIGVELNGIRVEQA